MFAYLFALFTRYNGKETIENLVYRKTQKLPKEAGRQNTQKAKKRPEAKTLFRSFFYDKN